LANKQLMLPANRAFNSDGLPEAGATAHLYLSGGLVPANFYADSGLVTSLGSTLTANSAGRFATTAYQDETIPFRLIIKDADGNELDDIDPFYFGHMTGSAGPQGANATVLTIGTITTGAAGSNASLTVTHIGGGVYEINGSIPRGNTGASGALSDGDMGDISVSGGGTVLTIDNGVVTNAKAANMVQATIKGRAAGAGTGVPTDLSAAQVAAILDAANIYLRQDASLVHEIWIPANSLIPRTTNGAATGSSESATNKIMRSTLDFDASTIEYAQTEIGMPKSWDEGNIAVKFVWEATNTGDVVWGAQAVCISDDDVTDAAFGSAQTVTDSVTATTDTMHTSYTSAITPGGTPAANDTMILQVYRNASAGADTLAVDAKLRGVWVRITTNAKDDS
jgi:hypothetical protein